MLAAPQCSQGLLPPPFTMLLSWLRWPGASLQDFESDTARRTRAQLCTLARVTLEVGYLLIGLNGIVRCIVPPTGSSLKMKVILEP